MLFLQWLIMIEYTLVKIFLFLKYMYMCNMISQTFRPI